MIFTLPGWPAVLTTDAGINGGLNALQETQMLTCTPNANSFDGPTPAKTDPGAPTSDNVLIGYSGGAMTRLERLKAATTEWTVAASAFYWQAYSDGGMPDAEFEAAVGLLGVAKACAKKHLNLLLEGQLDCEETFPFAFNEPGVTPPNTVAFGPVPEEVAVEQRAMLKRIQMMDLNPNMTLSLREEKHEDGSVTVYTTLVPKAAPTPAVNPIGKADPSRGDGGGEDGGDEHCAEEEGAEEVVRNRTADGAPKPVSPIAAKTAIRENGLTATPNEAGFFDFNEMSAEDAPAQAKLAGPRKEERFKSKKRTR
jgi:hypothetical protein